MDNNQKIKCEVKSCKFQDEHDCTLDSIQVGCDCDKEEATVEQETICRSFEHNEEKTED